MNYYGKNRTSVWIDPRWILMLNERGMTLSSFIGRTLPNFLDLPLDPREKLIQEKLDQVVLRARSTYVQEMNELLKEHSKETQIDFKEIELRDIGDKLRRTSAYPIFKKCLEKKEPNMDILQIVTNEVNGMNGSKFNDLDLWNVSLEWFKKFGALS